MGKNNLSGVCLFLKNSSGHLAAIKEHEHKPTLFSNPGKVKLIVEGLEEGESYKDGLIRLLEEELNFDHESAKEYFKYIDPVGTLVTSQLNHLYSATYTSGNLDDKPDPKIKELSTLVVRPTREFFSMAHRFPQIKWFPPMAGYFVDYHDRLSYTIKHFEANWPSYLYVTGPSGVGKTSLHKKYPSLDLDDLGKRVDDVWVVPLTRIFSFYEYVKSFSTQKKFVFMGASSNTENIANLSYRTLILKEHPATISTRGVLRDKLEDREGNRTEKDYLLWATDFYQKMSPYHYTEIDTDTDLTPFL